MNAKLKSKTFGPVFAFFTPTNMIHYATSETGERTSHAPAETPVDLLLASLAYCMIKSIEWAAENKGASLSAFSIKVTGVKAPNLPGRIENMTITVSGDLVEDVAMAEQIVKLAKSICTVSNTLNCGIEVAIDPANG